MTTLLPYVSRVLILIGGVCGLWGAVQIANQLTGTIDGWSDLAEVFMSAVVRGDKAKGAVAVSRNEKEHRLTTLQGLAFVFLGFLLQSAGALLDLFTFR